MPSASPPDLRRRSARGLLLAGAALVVALLVAGFAFGSTAVPARTEAPPFSLTLLDGETTISDSDFRGHPLVINAWASWCPPCREEAPMLERVSKDLAGDGVQFLGVVSDDTVADATAYAAEAGLDFPHALDDGSFDAVYVVDALPTTYVLDANGGIVAKHSGPISEARLRLLIAEAFAGTDRGASNGAE
ncbi:MAG: TlpA disulfide reductase family protein [Chloroflexi bacterium]|nr:TlpA disulfide reductase family protein [Chloroflexota bacterium]MDA1146341.1 TlpA disulfide reductase family protein [Chloroflexota bacterium]